MRSCADKGKSNVQPDLLYQVKKIKRAERDAENSMSDEDIITARQNDYLFTTS